MNEKLVEILQTEDKPDQAEAALRAITKNKLTHPVGVKYMGAEARV